MIAYSFDRILRLSPLRVFFSLTKYVRSHNVRITSLLGCVVNRGMGLEVISKLITPNELQSKITTMYGLQLPNCQVVID